MTAARRAAAKALTDALKSVPCHDCGGLFPPIAMDFDHLGGKLHNVAGMVSKGYSLTAIRAEALKCQVVCSNCHRIRTHLRRIAMPTIIDGVAYAEDFLPESYDAPETVDALAVGPDVEAVADAKQAAADLITGGDAVAAQPVTVEDDNSAPEFAPVEDAAPVTPQDEPVATDAEPEVEPVPAETEAVPAETPEAPVETPAEPEAEPTVDLPAETDPAAETLPPASDAEQTAEPTVITEAPVEAESEPAPTVTEAPAEAPVEAPAPDAPAEPDAPADPQVNG